MLLAQSNGSQWVVVVETETEASSVDAHPQVTVLGEIIDPDDRCAEARGGAHAKCPARAERIRYPTDNGRADGCAAQCYGENSSGRASRPAQAAMVSKPEGVALVASIAGHDSTRRLMISAPAANRVSRSGSSSWAMATCASHVRFACAGTFPARRRLFSVSTIFIWRPSVGCGLRSTKPISSERRDGRSHRLWFHAFRACQGSAVVAGPFFAARRAMTADSVHEELMHEAAAVRARRTNNPIA